MGSAQCDPDSTGALAFYAFKKALGRRAGQQTEPPASLTDDADPRGPAQGAGVAAVARSARWPSRSAAISASAGAAATAPGRSAAASLQDVGMATPRAISFAPSPDGKQQIGHTGQSSTQVVIMTDPPESYAVIPLGESDHKESGHWDDQAEKLFSKGKALRTYFMRPDELMKHVDVQEGA